MPETSDFANLAPCRQSESKGRDIGNGALAGRGRPEPGGSAHRDQDPPRQRPGPRLANEPERLLAAREYGPAVVSAMRLLELALRTKLVDSQLLPPRPVSIIELLELAVRQNLIDGNVRRRARDWLAV